MCRGPENGRTGRAGKAAAGKGAHPMTSMKDQTFGVEVEMVLSREKAAHTIAEHFGTRPRYVGGTYSAWKIPDGQGREWTVESDSSIDAPTSEAKCEFVTPICRWADIETLQALIRKLREAGGKAHHSCGIHVHIGLGEHTPKTLRNLVNIVNAHEDLLTQSLAISSNRRDRWCKPVDQRFLERLNRTRPTTPEAFAQLWYNDRDWQSHASVHYDFSRYHLLNLHAVWQKGTIEFRAFNSTLHAGEIKSYVQLCMAISFMALNASAASPRRPVTDNPAYTFRCWLLRLGMNGEEFKTARTHLLKNLPGNAAWRNGTPTARRTA